MIKEIQRVLVSVFWATVWTLMILLVYLFSISVFGSWDWNEQFSKLTIIFIIFIWSIVSNSLSSLFVSLNDSEKYTRLRSAIFHIFSINLALFVVSLLFYYSIKNIELVALVHIILSLVWSNILLEAFAKDKKFVLTWIYWSLIWAFILWITIKFLIWLSDGYTILFFLILPLSTLIISVTTIFTEKITAEISRLNWKDIFDLETEI